MKNFRANLTKLNKSMMLRLPDQNDIYGYAGVSKRMLLEAVESAYNLSRFIDESEDNGLVRLEIISLKRLGSGLFESLNSFLADSSDAKKAEKHFNRFLDEFSDLIEKIKFTYVVAVKNGLRTEEDYARIRAATLSLEEESVKFEGVVEKYSLELEAFKGQLSDIEEAHAKIAGQLESFDEWEAAGESCTMKVSAIAENAKEWDETIEERDSALTLAEKKVESLTTEVSELKRRLDVLTSTGEKVSSKTKEQSVANRKLLAEIEETLGDANRQGMAGSFKDRKDEIDKTHANWQTIFISTIIVIFGVSSYFFWGGASGGVVEWQTLVMRVTVIAPLVWLAWFAAKQYGVLNRVKEDYSFKYASSMAYEGFKKASREVDPELEQTLLEMSILNISQNPIRLIDRKGEYTSPAEEISSNFTDKLKKITSIKASDAAGNQVVAEMDGKIED